jgi:paraquat-inducible protein A
MTPRRTIAAALVIAACLTFAAGLVLPLFSIEPAAGRWTPVIKIFAKEQFAVQSYTLPGGIATLWSGGEIFLTILLGLLSLVLPVVKLCVLWWEAFSPDALPPGLLSFFRAVSRYAMVEVFLIALMVLMVKGMPGGSCITLHLGTYAFAASVLLGLAASHASERGDVQHLEII